MSRISECRGGGKYWIWGGTFYAELFGYGALANFWGCQCAKGARVEKPRSWTWTPPFWNAEYPFDKVASPKDVSIHRPSWVIWENERDGLVVMVYPKLIQLAVRVSVASLRETCTNFFPPEFRVFLPVYYLVYPRIVLFSRAVSTRRFKLDNVPGGNIRQTGNGRGS